MIPVRTDAAEKEREVVLMGEMRNARFNMNNPNSNQRPQTDGNCAKCSKMKKKLQELDFAIIETGLYLNAYPESREALNYYHRLIAEREAVAKNVNEKCGPLTLWQNTNRNEWNWTSAPWPWEIDAN